MEQTTEFRQQAGTNVLITGRSIPFDISSDSPTGLAYNLPIALEAEAYAASYAAAFDQEEDEGGYVELLALEAEAREEYRLMSLWGWA